jgi:hypothetical protein
LPVDHLFLESLDGPFFISFPFALGSSTAEIASIGLEGPDLPDRARLMTSLDSCGGAEYLRSSKPGQGVLVLANEDAVSGKMVSSSGNLEVLDNRTSLCFCASLLVRGSGSGPDA